MDRSKLAVILSLIIVICVLALIFIIPYACFLVNFWFGMIVSIVFVAGISCFLILVSKILEGNKNKEEYEKAVNNRKNRLMEQIIKIEKQRNNQ